MSLDTRIGDAGVAAISKAMKHNTVLTCVRNNFTSLLAASDWILITKAEERNLRLPTC